MRVKFINDLERKRFFNEVKLSRGKLWKDIQKEFGLLKGTLDKYKSGDLFLPSKLFESFSDSLSQSYRSNLNDYVEFLPDNFGQIKGGVSAYSKNFEHFQRGRIKGAKSLKKFRKETQVKSFDFSNIFLTGPLCEFAGAFIGDGFFNSYKNGLYQVEFAGDSRFDRDYYQSTIIPAILEIFPDLKPKIYDVAHKNSLRVVFYSKKLFFFLKDFFGFIPGRKTYSVKIPEKIMSSQRKFIFRCVRGIFDTDGTVFFDKRKIYGQPYPRVCLQIVSKNLFDQLKNELGKSFKLYTRFNKKRNVYIIEIYGISQFNNWMKKIGFSNKRHLDRIASVAQVVGVRHW